MPLLKLFSREWWVTTLLVFAATLMMIRLGIWQLDRLTHRRTFNAQVAAMRMQPVLDLNQNQLADLTTMEWRPVQVSGKYDFENQVAVRNQYYGNQFGYHLLTPLFTQGMAVLVDRGWIPAEGNSTPEDWRKYDQPGDVTISGQIRLGSGKPAFGGVADALPADGSRLAIWNNADLQQISSQLPYPVMPVYVQIDEDLLDAEPPIPVQPQLDLTEGPHLGYAFQWFMFATILSVSYPFYVRRQESKRI